MIFINRIKGIPEKKKKKLFHLYEMIYNTFCHTYESAKYLIYCQVDEPLPGAELVHPQLQVLDSADAIPPRTTGLTLNLIRCCDVILVVITTLIYRFHFEWLNDNARIQLAFS